MARRSSRRNFLKTGTLASAGNGNARDLALGM